ncbi:MAG TPA: class I SAM-dependent methyltransferase [Verrucomicrobiae bacterium]|nr:class I SAM-dependent methyltransferase [Verrucomicrobiae bacterium]
MPAEGKPSPDAIFDAITAYQKTAAMKAAVDLDVFTHLAEAPATAAELAKHCGAAERGIRILCDYLAVHGFLTKAGNTYAATQDTGVFLNRKSPAYAGGALDFLLSTELDGAFESLSEAVRRGGTARPNQGSVAPDHPMWITFARAMGGLMVPASHGLAELIPLDRNQPLRVLDVAAGHGMWGIGFAKEFPQAHIVALDWESVLQVARENAQQNGLANRFSSITGNAFEVDLGRDYDVVLVPNFLHHFNAADCVKFLKRVHTALKPNGCVAIVEFVPNPDRISPPGSAGFSLVMLATTPEGDAYTLAEYAEMLSQSGFEPPKLHPLPASVNQAVISKRR